MSSSHSPPYFLSLSIACELLHSVRLVANELEGAACLRILSDGIKEAPCLFLFLCWGSEFRAAHLCGNELSPKPPKKMFPKIQGRYQGAG